MNDYNTNDYNTNDYAHPEVLVSTQWLAEHLADDDLRIVEVDMDESSNQGAHIPGAIFWSTFRDLLGADFRQKLTPTAIAALLSRSGITPETTVIAYGSYPGTGGWLFWMLQLIGHQNVRVLNGGYRKWLSESRPVIGEFSRYEPTDYPAVQINNDLRAFYPEVCSAMNSSEKVLLDGRTIQEYSGEHFLMQPPEGAERAGHIPGAVHIEQVLTLNADGTLKTFDELQKLYGDRGVTPEKSVIAYCAIGARAGYLWFVLTYLLGYPDVRNYDGSWNEWSRQPDSLVEL